LIHTASAQRQHTLSCRRTCLREFLSDLVTGKASLLRIVLPVDNRSPYMYESASYTRLVLIAATRNTQCKGSLKDLGRSLRTLILPVVSIQYLVVEAVMYSSSADASGGRNVLSILYRSRI
jgi:hypothetical protein